MKKTKITPSILNANFLYLDWELQRLKKARLARIHYDVMDFDFVPNLTFGAKILSDIRAKYKDFYIDIHFMVKIKTPDLYQFFRPFIECKPNLMTMHIEALKHNQIKVFFDICKRHNIKTSLAVKPLTPVEKLLPYLKEVDNILVMTVEPGFGGQQLIPGTLKKIKELAFLRKKENYHYTIEVDGGITPNNINEVIANGTDDVVVGSYLFKSKNLKKAYNALKK